MQNKNLSPSERAEAKAKADAEIKAHNEAVLEDLRHDFGIVAQTPEGKRVLAWLCQYCNFGKVILTAKKDGELDPIKTMYAAMELNIWLTVRQYIQTKILQEIEYGYIDPSGTIRKPDGRTTAKRKRTVR